MATDLKDKLALVQANTRVGRWLVLAPAPPKHHRAYWYCRCDCGVERVVQETGLRHGSSRSCGCLRVDTARALFTTHAHLTNGKYSPEWQAWKQIKYRCLNPQSKEYKNYGARGITMFEGWVTSFPAFYAHVGPRPGPEYSIDRIDNSRGYQPGNLRWATIKQQLNNTRRNHYLTFNGKTQNCTQWADELGIHRNLIQTRLHSGMPVERVLHVGNLQRRARA